MSQARSGFAVTAAALLAIALTACGPGGGTPEPPEPSTTAAGSATEDLSPADLLKLAVRNTLDAESKRLTGTAEVSVVTQEFEVVFVGPDAKGHRVTRSSGIESPVEFARVGDRLYILATEHYWQAYVNLEQLVLVTNVWTSVPADHPDHSTLLVLTGTDDALWQPTGELRSEAGSNGSTVLTDEAGTRFTIGSGDTPYLTRVQAVQDSEAGPVTIDIEFSDFGAITETITAPPGPVVELS
jgi:hypothetical protein